MSRRPLLGRLPLRSRLALISALAVAVGVAAASLFAYLATAGTLHEQVDRTLQSPPMGAVPAAAEPMLSRLDLDIDLLCSDSLGLGVPPSFGSAQLVRADGTTCAPPGRPLVAPRPEDVAAAAGGVATALRDDVTDAGDPVRVRTQPLTDGYALLLSRDLGEIDAILASLAVTLLIASGTGVLLAASAGLLVARAGLRPVGELTRAAEHVADTQDLDVPITVAGDDEVARLAGAFNRMTAALAAARARQQQLVADAGHELRTPLTSLRTNIELLLRSDSSGRPLPPTDRAALLGGIAAQLAELAELVSELTVLAHDEPAAAPVEIRFDEVVRRAVARAGRRGDVTFTATLQPWTTRGDPVALERAVLNVLDNAVKFSPARSRVQVELRRGVLTVTDEGVGLSEDEAERVFDRFWRSPSARALPGSGLGLAIVADVVAAHGGRVRAASAGGRGARIVIELPEHGPPDDSAP